MTLKPEDRVVVCNRRSISTRSWPTQVARRLGLKESPAKAAKHVLFSADGEYKSVFRVPDASSRPEHIGKGLEGKTVYIISTDSTKHSRQELTMHNYLIANTARYNGATSVVLVQPNLWYAAQERGVHDTAHPRMQTLEQKLKFDGEGPSLRFVAELYKVAGIDAILTVHSHCPESVQRIFTEVYQRDNVVFDLDISSVVGQYFGQQRMNGQIVVENKGENVVFVAPDEGAASFVDKIWHAALLPNASIIYGLKKRSDETSVQITFNRTSVNYSGYHKKTLILCDDMIRTGGTLARNVDLLYTPDASPARVILYATHSSLQEANERLNTSRIHDIVITNSVPTVFHYCGELEDVLTVLEIGGYVADALEHCLENKKQPEDVYTHSFIEKNFSRLVKVTCPETHYTRK